MTLPQQVGLPAGGITRSMRATPACSATPNYADGDNVGGLLTFTDFVRGAPGSGLLTRLAIKSKVTITVNTFFHIFDTNPSATTFTDNAAQAIHANDWTKILRSILIDSTDWILMGTGLYQAEKVIAVPYEIDTSASSRNLYGAIESDGVIDLASASDLEVILGAESN